MLGDNVEGGFVFGEFEGVFVGLVGRRDGFGEGGFVERRDGSGDGAYVIVKDD